MATLTRTLGAVKRQPFPIVVVRGQAGGLGLDSGISKSEVSRICAGLDETVDAFRNRPLHHTSFPYVFLDATYQWPTALRSRSLFRNGTFVGPGGSSLRASSVLSASAVAGRESARRIRRDRAV